MRALSWAIVAAVGLGVMVTAYMTRAQVDPDATWASGLIVIGPELPVNLANVGSARAGCACGSCRHPNKPRPSSRS